MSKDFSKFLHFRELFVVAQFDETRITVSARSKYTILPVLHSRRCSVATGRAVSRLFFPSRFSHFARPISCTSWASPEKSLTANALEEKKNVRGRTRDGRHLPFRSFRTLDRRPWPAAPGRLIPNPNGRRTLGTRPECSIRL